MLSDSYLYVINGGLFEDTRYNTSNHFHTILRWGYFLNYTVLPIAIFFKSRLFKNIASYVCLAFSVLSVIYFNEYMGYFLSPLGKGLHFNPTFRRMYFAFELILAIVIPVVMQIKQKHYFNIFDKWEWIKFFTLFPIIALTLVPVYVPQALIGYSSYTPQKGGNYHILWILFIIALVLVIYHLFRFRSYHDRFLLCVFLTIALFYHYDTLYLMGFTYKRLPVQLCNVAAYFYIIAIPLKLKRMFNFCFLTNVVGALIAIVIPTFSYGDTSFWALHYVFEHTLVFAIPLICMGLRIFPRLTPKAILHSFVGFTIYFVCVFLIGTHVNGYASRIGYRVNYFYMFDLEFAYKHFSFLKFTRYYHYEFGRYEVYPLVILIVYLGYQVFYLLSYALTKLFYKIEDDHIALRLSGITLYEEITGKTSKRPKDFID